MAFERLEWVDIPCDSQLAGPLGIPKLIEFELPTIDVKDAAAQ
jgi:hypothetical protein